MPPTRKVRPGGYLTLTPYKVRPGDFSARALSDYPCRALPGHASPCHTIPSSAEPNPCLGAYGLKPVRPYCRHLLAADIKCTGWRLPCLATPFVTQRHLWSQPLADVTERNTRPLYRQMVHVPVADPRRSSPPVAPIWKRYAGTHPASQPPHLGSSQQLPESAVVLPVMATESRNRLSVPERRS